MMHIKPFNERKTYDCSNPECDNKIESKPDENKCPVCGENVIEKDTITYKNGTAPNYYDYDDIDLYELKKELEKIQYLIGDCIHSGDEDSARKYYSRFIELRELYNRYYGGKHRYRNYSPGRW
jgi:predicted RNA-binding Zn-ribbon protein involved in translation (DUF1610 family)